MGTQQYVVAETDAQACIALEEQEYPSVRDCYALLHDVEEMAVTFASFDVVYARRTANFHYKKNICSNRTIFFVGAAGDGAAPTVGVLRTHETSRPYKWHSRAGW